MRGRGYAAEQAGHRAATGAQTSQARQPHGPGQTAPGLGMSGAGTTTAARPGQREITNHAPTTREY